MGAMRWLLGILDWLFGNNLIQCLREPRASKHASLVHPKNLEANQSQSQQITA
jgi:hypothetical protein